MSGAGGREDLIRKLSQSSETTITVTGRTSKRRVSVPVWFVVEGDTVLLVPTKGSRNEWFRNLQEDPTIELGTPGAGHVFRARLVKGHDEVEGVLDKFRAKYRSMWSEAYYTNRDVYVEVPI